MQKRDFSIQHYSFSPRHRLEYSRSLKSFDCADQTGSGMLDLVWSYPRAQARKSPGTRVGVLPSLFIHSTRLQTPTQHFLHVNSRT